MGARGKRLFAVRWRSMFFVVDTHIADELGLTGSDLLVYSALAYLSKNKAWKGNYSKLARYSGCGSYHVAKRTLERLIIRGLIIHTEDGYQIRQNVQADRQNVQVDRQNVSKSKESNKENINNIKRTSVNIKTDGQTDFNLFWSSYAPAGAYRKYKRATQKVWSEMPTDWHALALERASEHEPDRNPYWFLKDEDFLKVSAKEIKTEKPEWLTPDEQDDCLKAGIPICICRDPETGLYKVTTKQQAEQFGLEIKSQIK